VDLKLNLPTTNLQHLALYTNLNGKSRDITDSDTYIIYEKGQSLQKVDPHGLFANVKLDIDTKGALNKIDYKITFAKPMDTSDIIFRAWNDRSSSADVKLHDVWQVVDSLVTIPSQLSSTTQQQIPVPQPSQPNTASESKVPSWIKNNARLWNSGSIGDTEFETGVQYLITQKIINIPKQTVDQSASDTIPEWVKNNAGYWANGEVADDEFLKGIEYLVKVGIIRVG
jgi:hypothetical protein